MLYYTKACLNLFFEKGSSGAPLTNEQEVAVRLYRTKIVIQHFVDYRYSPTGMNIHKFIISDSDLNGAELKSK